MNLDWAGNERCPLKMINGVSSCQGYQDGLIGCISFTGKLRKCSVLENYF